MTEQNLRLRSVVFGALSGLDDFFDSSQLQESTVGLQLSSKSKILLLLYFIVAILLHPGPEPRDRDYGSSIHSLVPRPLSSDLLVARGNRWVAVFRFVFSALRTASSRMYAGANDVVESHGSGDL